MSDDEWDDWLNDPDPLRRDDKPEQEKPEKEPKPPRERVTRPRTTRPRGGGRQGNTQDEVIKLILVLLGLIVAAAILERFTPVVGDLAGQAWAAVQAWVAAHMPGS